MTILGGLCFIHAEFATVESQTSGLHLKFESTLQNAGVPTLAKTMPAFP